MTALFDADFIHPIPESPGHEWQESVVLFFHDEAAGVSMYCRIGTQPPKNVCQEWVYVQTRDGARFRRMRFGLPLTDRSRRPDGFGAGGLDWTYHADGTIRLWDVKSHKQVGGPLVGPEGIGLSGYRYNIGGGGAGVNNPVRAPETF